MIRTLFAALVIAVSAVAAVPAAQACVSCQYTPEVLGSSDKPAKLRTRAHVDSAFRSRKSRANRDVVERKSPPKRTRAAKAPAEKPAEDKATTTTTAAPSETDNGRAQSVYNTLIKTAKPADTNPAAAEAPPPAVEKAAVKAPAKPAAATTEKVAATADVVKDDTATSEIPAAESENVNVSEDKGDKSTGCKKFFPMAGLTLTVECK